MTSASVLMVLIAFQLCAQLEFVHQTAQELLLMVTTASVQQILIARVLIAQLQILARTHAQVLRVLDHTLMDVTASTEPIACLQHAQAMFVHQTALLDQLPTDTTVIALTTQNAAQDIVAQVTPARILA